MTAPKPPRTSPELDKALDFLLKYPAQPLSGAAPAPQRFDELSAEADKFTYAYWHEMDRDVFKYELLKLLSRITRPAAPVAVPAEPRLELFLTRPMAVKLDEIIRHWMDKEGDYCQFCDAVGEPVKLCADCQTIKDLHYNVLVIAGGK